MIRRIVVAAVLAVSVGATVGAVDVPLLFAVMDIGTAKSLPWSSRDNFLGIRDDYDVHHLVGDLEMLLTPSTPTVVRMETLRRAAVYASRDHEVTKQLVALVITRATALRIPGQPDPMALFDAGYIVEVLNELEQFGPGSKMFWRFDHTIVEISRPYDGCALLKESAALRPNDPVIQFAVALSQPQAPEPYLSKARAGARDDELLAINLARMQLLQ